jgi:hypothetical protein
LETTWNRLILISIVVLFGEIFKAASMTPYQRQRSLKGDVRQNSLKMAVVLRWLECTKLEEVTEPNSRDFNDQ